MPEDALSTTQYLNLDPSLYVREDVWQEERRRIFARTWQFMGPVSQVAEAGQYLAIDIAGTPVFAIRGKDARGFGGVDCGGFSEFLLLDQ